MAKVAAKRHIVKAITWRIVGTLDTMAISWIVTGDVKAGIKIGLSELLTKTILYYLHERFWYSVKVLETKSRLRHLLKTVTWRFVGTIDTIIISWFITEKAEIGLMIGGFELFSKMILYYFHERVWYRSKFGVIK